MYLYKRVQKVFFSNFSLRLFLCIFRIIRKSRIFNWIRYLKAVDHPSARPFFSPPLRWRRNRRYVNLAVFMQQPSWAFFFNKNAKKKDENKLHIFSTSLILKKEQGHTTFKSNETKTRKAIWIVIIIIKSIFSRMNMFYY